MEISVIVCTHGPAEGLKRLLASAAALDVPDGLAWELLVVDNGGGAVGEVAARFGSGLPLRMVAEPRPGLSHARNRGLAEAKGRHLCWTDDDVTLDRAWLRAWADAFRSHPDAAVFGGTILPVPEEPCPRWFARGFDDWPLLSLTATRRPASEIPISPSDLPWGANFALRASALGSARFDPELGHGPPQRTGEETALIHRLVRAGASGWWIPGSIAFHHIGRDRQTLPHVRDYFRRSGETAAFLHASAPHDTGARWNPAAAPRPLLHLLATASAPVSLLVHIAGLERLGLRFLARRHLYRGILGYRRATPRPATDLRAAGQT